MSYRFIIFFEVNYLISKHITVYTPVLKNERIQQIEESAAVKIIKHRYGSTAPIILGTASGQFLAVTVDEPCAAGAVFCKAYTKKSAQIALQKPRTSPCLTVRQIK